MGEERFYREVGAPFAPRFLGVADGWLLLEDVGGRQGDVLTGCSVDEAMLVLEPLAHFHATHSGGRSGFPSRGSDPQASQERYAARADIFLERHGEQLPPAVVELVDMLRARLRDLMVELAAVPPTLIHGDLHLDNVLFDAGDRPAVVLDWQRTANGPAAWDVVLFLYGSLSPDERRSVEAEVLEWYATELAFSLEELRRHCALALLVHLAGVVGWLSRDLPQSTRRREAAVRDAVLADGRLVTALADLPEGVVRPGA